MLDNNCGTVRQCELCVAQLVVLHFLLDRASLRLCCHDRLVLDVVHVGCDVLGTGSLESLKEVCLCRINIALSLVVEVYDNDVAVVLGYQLLHHLVDSLNRNHRNNLLHYRICELDRRHWLVLKEVVHEVAVERAVRTLVLVAVLLVENAKEVVLEAGILGSCEAKACGTQSLYIGSLEALYCLAEVLGVG